MYIEWEVLVIIGSIKRTDRIFLVGIEDKAIVGMELMNNGFQVYLRQDLLKIGAQPS